MKGPLNSVTNNVVLRRVNINKC